MIDAWSHRPESLGIMVSDVSGTLLFKGVGDRMHRFVSRNHDIPLFVAFSVHTQIRPLIALVVVGRKVACFVDAQDDIGHVARRFYSFAPGHLATMPVAVYDDGVWSSHKLSELL